MEQGWRLLLTCAEDTTSAAVVKAVTRVGGSGSCRHWERSGFFPPTCPRGHSTKARRKRWRRRASRQTPLFSCGWAGDRSEPSCHAAPAAAGADVGARGRARETSLRRRCSLDCWLHRWQLADEWRAGWCRQDRSCRWGEPARSLGGRLCRPFIFLREFFFFAYSWPSSIFRSQLEGVYSTESLFSFPSAVALRHKGLPGRRTRQAAES